MAGEKFLVSLCLVTVLVGMLRGSEASYQSVPSQENVFHHGLKIVRPAESSEHYSSSQEASFYQQHPVEYQHPVQAPLSTESHHLHYQAPEQQYVVQSGYNVGSHQQGQLVAHQPEPAVHQQQQQQQHQQPQQQHQQLKQRQTALPYNNQRLHVKIEYPGAGHGIARPNGSASHPAVHEPTQDYRASIPKSIAPKLNPLHHSFHQKRNFVPLHHITRQVPVPAGRHAHGHPPHSQHHQSQPAEQHPVKAALAGPPPKHIAG